MNKREELFLRIINVALRGSTLLSKFLLLFFLASYLPSEDFGLYGLIVASIAFGIYPLGLEFYTYSTREMIKSDKSKLGILLKSQIVLHATLYLIILPLFLFIFILGFLPWEIIGWFYILLIFEHINQELMRLLIAISQQITASFALFFRQGIWSLAIVYIMHEYPAYRHINFLFSAWMLGSILALAISVYKLKTFKITIFNKKIQWDWIKKGIYISLPFFLSTLCLNAISTIDKYWFGFLLGHKTLGAYIFFIGLAAALVSFLDAAVFSFSYPALVSAFANKEFIEFRMHMKKMFEQVFFFSILFFFGAFFFIKPILALVGKNIYEQSLPIFYILVIFTLIQVISYIPHYGLYSQGLDGVIIKSHIAALFLFIISVFFLSKLTSLYAVPISLCLAYTMILLCKTIAFYQLTPKEYQKFMVS